MKKMKYIIFGLFALMFVTTSCEDFLDITPDGQVKRDPLLSTAEGIEDAMYGVYSQMRSTTLYGQELYFSALEILAQNMHCDGNVTVTPLSAYDYTNTNVKNLFANVWTQMYKNISNVNSVLDAPLVANAKEFPYTIYRGEALGLRAFMHFDLVRIFTPQYTLDTTVEGIPYSTDFSLNTPEFESLEKNYEHILADLLEAERLLADEEDYEGSGNFMLDRQIHFNKYAVWGTLARVYLTMGKKEKAKEYALKTIGGKYSIKEKTEVENDLAGILSKKECLFGLYSSTFFEQVYAKLHLTTTRYSLDLRNDYMTIYEKDNSGLDYRIDAYFTPVTQGSEKVYRLKKLTEYYELNNMAANRPVELILGINLIRLPEMYYIIAEALLEENPAEALSYYNEIRVNRGLEPLTGTSLDENTGEVVERPLTLEQINEERYKEFFGEGQYFFNKKRLNLPILSYDGATEYKPSNGIFVVPIPDAERENRY